uniref:Hexosyltransferase n=1 Tax=Angiostrongylus cantonensis TaxID=6313 RepID=A0A0K0D7A5_ANGCA
MFHQHYCPQTLFLMKVDDDVCIDIDRILTDWNIEKNGSISSIYCHKAYEGPAVRDPKHKLFVPKHIWPMPYFPTYCGGPAYIMGRSAEQAILDEARNFPPFYIELTAYTMLVADVLQRAEVKRKICYRFVPKHIWPMPYFPTYCGGPAYIMGRSAEQAILDEARNFPPFYIEDVFYTGILAESIGIERVDWVAKGNLYELSFPGSFNCHLSQEKMLAPVKFS